jgi:5-methylcytosine-specific restriction protein A
VSKRRKITIRDSDKELRGQHGPNGYRLCRWCKKEVQPPRRTFCCDECIHEWRLRSNVGYLREHTYKRDLGICALCKSDTRLQKIQLENVLKSCNYNEKVDEYKVLLVVLNITIKEARKSLWHADHIVPVVDGGGLCGLSNIQTLCVRCHKLKSEVHAGSNAKPRKLKVLKVQGVQSLPGIKGFSGKIED